MALALFVLNTDVTLAADTLTAGTGGWGNSTGTDAAGHWGTCGPQVVPSGTVVMADSSVGTTGPQNLYVALGGAANLRAYVAGQDDTGHAAISN